MVQIREIGYYVEITDKEVEGFPRFFTNETAALAEVRKLEVHGTQEGLNSGDTIRGFYWSGKGEVTLPSGTRRVQA